MSEKNSSKPSRRDFLKTGFLATAAAAGVSGSAANAKEFTKNFLFETNNAALNQPNILILMVDEQRYPTVYESASLQFFRRQYLRTQEMLRLHGMEFHRHYTASTACAPSRTSFYTGHYPSLHGVTNTDGAAKSANDDDIFWLDPNTVPTVGDYFRAAGYRTFWKGKWHISHADIEIPGTTNSLASYDSGGNRDAAREQLYINAGRLEEYGFSGWIGPEPHGSAPLNSGSSAGGGKKSRDEAFADQTIELLQQLDANPSNQPWLTVASFVNPHDIAMYGFVSRLGELAGLYDFSVNKRVPEDLFDEEMFASSKGENLLLKPSCQKSYRDSYSEFFQPTLMTPEFFRLYYQLHWNVDMQLERVYTALRLTRFFQNTIVVFTSDHGELLGAHGGMHQKWYQTYDEALRVPLIVSNPVLFAQPAAQTIPTSHVDIVPTLLGLAGLDAESLRQALAQSHTEARPFVGRNLAPLIEGQAPPAAIEAPVYFMTDDDPSRGDNQQNFVGIAYDSVVQPNHIECVITRVDAHLWKYTRYFDNPQFWSNPGVPGTLNVKDVVLKPVPPQPDLPGETLVAYTKRTKYQPQPEEFEMYNLSGDPLELDNLAGKPAHAVTEAILRNLLGSQCAQKRLTPQSGSVTGQPGCA
ncbi:MAG TPA: sulfatase-like hydrolase/transferase [Pyrinomonadaceae bacterium]|jgi:choline-sulfatase